MSETETKIQALTAGQVTQAVKLLVEALEAEAGRFVEDDEVRAALQAAAPTGLADDLRRQILDGTNDPAAFDRWGRSLLGFAATDPELAPLAEAAVAGAARAGAKAIGLSSLIVIGAVLVLLKYRPKKVVVASDGKRRHIQVEWNENDVRAVSDLAAVTGS
jgi:hypothetical protein